MNCNALLQVKPLDHSLDNVNGRGCNETAQGELSQRAE